MATELPHGRAILRVSPEFLVDLCKPGPPRRAEIVNNALPPDTVFLGMQHAANWRDIELVLASDAWPPPATEGEPIPVLEPTTFQIVESDLYLLTLVQRLRRWLKHALYNVRGALSGVRSQ